MGTDKADIPYFEFVVGDAYRKAGLRYLTGADTNYAAAWSLKASNLVDVNTSKLLPSFILAAGAVVTPSGAITDASLGGTASAPGTAALDEKGGFTGFVSQSGGKPDYTGLLVQTGNDLGGVVSLTGTNTYHGGTVILDGTLRISSDAALGDASGALLFRSIAEGNGTLQAAANLTINRNIDVGAETATIDPAGFQVTINGVISGTQTLVFGNQGNTPNGSGGIVTLTGTNTTEGSTTVNSGVTLQISSDANLGANNYTADPNQYFIGQLNLSKSTLQTLAAVTSQRTLNINGSATINPNSFSSSFGTVNLNDTTLKVGDIASVSTAGSTTTTFAKLLPNGGAVLTIDNTNAGAGNATTVQIGALTRTPTVIAYLNSFASTLTVNSVTGALVTSGAGETVKITNAPALTNGIVDPWVVGQAGTTSSASDFLTYSGGLKAATYTSTSLATAAATDVVNSGAASISGASTAYALKLAGALSGAGSLTLGNGSNPAGLILNAGTVSVPLNVGASELVVTSSGKSAINGVITGANGLTVAGTGTLTLSAVENIKGSVSVTGAGLTLNAANALSSASGGVNLAAASTLTLGANQAIAGLNGAGSVTMNAYNLIIGTPGSTIYSAYNGKFKGTGGLEIANGVELDVSNAGGSALGYTGATLIDAGSTLLIKSTNWSSSNTLPVTDNGLFLFDQGGGGSFNNAIVGTGAVNVISGAVTFTSTGNTYTGGTTVVFGGSLYASTTTLPVGGKVYNDGIFVLDQATAGTWTGVIADAQRPGYGKVIIDDSYDAYNGDTTSGTAGGKTSYTGAATGNITFAAQQLYTGATYVNYGTLTLGVTDAVKSSSGVTLEPGAVLALGANNQIAALLSDSYVGTAPGGTVLLNGATLTVGDSRGLSSTFSGVIKDGSAAGSLVKAGSGALTLAGANTYTGATSVTGGSLGFSGSGSLASASLAIGSGATLNAGAAASTLPKLTALTNNGVVNLQNGAPGNVLTVNGAYVGGSGSQLLVNAALGGANSVADRLVVNSASGSTAIVVTDTTPGVAATYNPTGTPVVVSKTALAANAFTLANVPIQKGLFTIDLAYQPDPQFVLIGVPGVDAYRLPTLTTAAQNVWFDTAGVYEDRQIELRDQIRAPAPAPKVVKGYDKPKAAPAPAPEAGGFHPSLWARAIGIYSDRAQNRSLSVLGNNYNYNTGYTQKTGAFFGGIDAIGRGVLTGGDALSAGVMAGAINSYQDFKASSASAKLNGASVGVTATYVSRSFFINALLKGDFLRLNYSSPTLATFGTSKTSADATNLGAIVDVGYRYDLAPHSFIEPVASLGYVSTKIGQLSLGGSQVSFSNASALRGRVGLRLGAALIESAAYRLEATATASYWARLTGDATAAINSGANAPLLSLKDKQVKSYGEVGVGLDYLSLTSGLSGFLKADYQIASKYQSISGKLGLRYDF